MKRWSSIFFLCFLLWGCSELPPQSGHGTYNYDNGTYAGEFKDGMPHGQGTFTQDDGALYVGEWKEGKKHGLGTLTGANGDKYVGNLKDSKPHGRGTYRWANGNKYVGEYTDGNAWQGTKYDGNGKVIATWIGGVETFK